MIDRITFPRPTKALLSMNDRSHWRKRAADNAVWRSAACVAAVRARGARLVGVFPPAMIVVTLDVHGNRRRDPMNAVASVKPLVDGLVDAGWWPDDTSEYVTIVEPVLRVVPAAAPLMVTVELLPR